MKLCKTGGFDMAGDMPAGVGVNIPCTFINGASQLSLVAKSDTRVHVERANGFKTSGASELHF